MPRFVIAGLLAAALIPAAALAQQPPAADRRDQMAVQRPDMPQGENEMLLNNLRQQPVYYGENIAVGEIEDVLIDPSGQVKAVLIDVSRGGASRLVAIPYSSLEIRKGPAGGPTTRTVQVFVKGGREEVEKAPLFRPAGAGPRP
jgi:sporulation protein YlmC with PRC-barrel domain